MFEPLVTNSAEYKRVHKAIEKERGKASAHKCLCGKQAYEWSWTHTKDPRDVYSYDAACMSCHDLYDRKKGWKQGEKNGRAKITEDEALEIRRLYSTGDWTQKDLAECYMISQRSVSNIVNRQTWRHI